MGAPQVLDGDGNPVLSQVVAVPNAGDGEYVLTFLADVPAAGLNTYYIRAAYETPPKSSGRNGAAGTNVAFRAVTLPNHIRPRAAPNRARSLPSRWPWASASS